MAVVVHKCSVCDTPIPSGEATRAGPRLCRECRAVQFSLEARRDRLAYKIDGEPWWLSARSQVVVQYDAFQRLEEETSVAHEHGWTIAQTDTLDGHVNLGRIFLFGAASALTGLRSKGTITITWEKARLSASDANALDPVLILRQLKEMLESELISVIEYEQKKAEVLARM